MTLPEGWRESTLGELGRYLNGRGFKKSEWGSVGRPIIRIQNLTGSNSEFNHFDGLVDERNVVRKGDLLVSWAATLGAYIWNGPEALVNQHIFKVESFIDPQFHKYLLDQKLAELMQRTHGSGMVHVTRGRFESLPVVVPPLDEQHRIVEILEEQFSRLDGASDLLDQAAQRASAAIAASAESLLAEGDDVHLGELGTVVTGATPSTRNNGSFVGRTWFVTPSDVGRGGRVLDASRRVSGEASRHRVVGPGAVLVVCIGATIGKVGWVDRQVMTNQQINAVQVDSELASAEYVAWSLAAPSMQRQIGDAASSTTMPILNKSKFSRIVLRLPPAVVQAELLTSHLAVVDATSHLQEAIAAANARAGGVRRALLQAAFSGRLTGHPSDIDRAEELAYA